MFDFVRFANNAKNKKKIMVITHSSISTNGYQSTTQTANYLIKQMEIKRDVCHVSDEIGIHYYRCNAGNFHIKGYYGETAGDHLKHLYSMDKSLRLVCKILKKKNE